MEDTLEIFRTGGFAIGKTATRAAIAALLMACPKGGKVFSASEIARHLQSGRIDLGVTGEDPSGADPQRRRARVLSP